MRRLNVRQLEAFRAVMLSGTTTAAARAMGVSQPSISRLIGELEAHLGIELFLRESGSLAPTKEAEYFFTEANDFLSRFDRLEAIARDVHKSPVGQLRIIATPALAFGIVPDGIARLRQAFPSIHATAQISFRREVRMLTEAQHFDISLSTLPIEYPTAHSEHLAGVNGVCVLPRLHLLRKKKTIQAEDLADVDFVTSVAETNTRFRLDQYFDNLGIIRQRQYVESHTALNVCRMVSAGLGVSVVDPFTAQACLPLGIVIRPLSPVFRYEFGILYPIRAPRLRIAQTFAEIMRQIVAEHPQYEP